MPDILQDFPIKATPAEVFQAVSTPEGLAQWWTETSAGHPAAESEYELGFGPEYQWRAVVSCFDPAKRFELTLTKADGDWTGSKVGFELGPSERGTQVRFYHRGWPSENEHYRISCHCWAMYLRLLRRHLEAGEFVPYAERLDV